MSTLPIERFLSMLRLSHELSATPVYSRSKQCSAAPRPLRATSGLIPDTSGLGTRIVDWLVCLEVMRGPRSPKGTTSSCDVRKARIW